MENLWERLFAYFWSFLVFASIAWYGFLLFYVGFKGGVEIFAMAGRLSQEPEKKS